MPLAGISAKLSRAFAVAGYFVGAAGVALCLISYVCLLVMRGDSPHRDFVYLVLAICMVACLLFMFGWKSRTLSSSEEVFYGGGLRAAEGRLWRSLRMALWGSFAVCMIHLVFVLQLPLPERKLSPHLELFITAFTFYFTCLMLFGQLYGVHALALYRFFWEVFHGTRSSERQRSRWFSLGLMNFSNRKGGSVAKLFGRFTNPTADWPSLGRHELVYDLCSRSVNGLSLGGAFGDAQRFGRCDDCTRTGKSLDLFYCKSGLCLEFESKRLIGIILVVGSSSYYVHVRKMGVNFPCIVDAAARRHVLKDSSTLQDLILCFGQPVESEPVGNEMMHSFIAQKNFVDASLDPKTGRLLHLEICEAEDA